MQKIPKADSDSYNSKVLRKWLLRRIIKCGIRDTLYLKDKEDEGSWNFINLVPKNNKITIIQTIWLNDWEHFYKKLFTDGID